MKTKILNILRNSKDYVSGQAICDMLGVSRTAVWKCIQQLKEEGYEFDAINNRGYRIIKYPDLVTESEIESQLSTEDIVKSVVYFDELDSTNNEAKRCAENGAKDGTLYITECQTGGRGRRGRQWVSPAGTGIWMSLLIRPEIAPSHASMLTLVSAVAVAKAINEVLGDTAQCAIKWPNDIVVNHHKVCGILTEMSAEMSCMNFVVIGIGINVNTTDFDSDISWMASSLKNEAGKDIKRSALVASFSHYFTEYYHRFLKDENLSGIVDEYNEVLINRGNEVKILESTSEYTGIAHGINQLGELIVEKKDKTMVNIMAGEVSVRGLYGYV
jgi:BirA family biotin operon repressor/biotin-[acetyl-CoA-carboxylase] ligase